MLAAHAAWSEMAVVKTAALTDALAAGRPEWSEPGQSRNGKGKGNPAHGY